MEQPGENTTEQPATEQYTRPYLAGSASTPARGGRSRLIYIGATVGAAGLVGISAYLYTVLGSQPAPRDPRGR